MKEKFKMPKMPKMPAVNWKLFIVMLLMIVLVGTVVKCVPKFIVGGDMEVSFSLLEKNEVPEKIEQILPRYKMLERALAAKSDDGIYVIVTRGEKLTGGYEVDIEKIEMVENEDQKELIVYAVFEDPDPDDLVPQVISHPYVVVKTELEELPEKINLITRKRE